MIYAWGHPSNRERNRSPRVLFNPEYSFTAIIPARHEEKVIGDTIRAVSRIDYPLELTEVLVVLREDDQGTISAAKAAIETTGRKNTKIITFDGYPINKPHGLNVALKKAKNDVVVIFDAEDEPHPEIYHIVNTVMMRDAADVVQCGVQLMNFRSNWYSSLNVLEYFFWFKSAMQFFSKRGVIPLGGNTIFIKREWLEEVHGWDQHCLTEDADIGLKLSTKGANIRVVYDEVHATQEETPPTLHGFIKQRTRWNQGFIHVLRKGLWRRIPSIQQRLLALYILGWPIVQAFLFILIPLSVLIALTMKLPAGLVVITTIPLYLIFIQAVVLMLGLWQFSKDYHQPISLLYPLRLIFYVIPYQCMLGYAALRALFRTIQRRNTWEKTEHINAHRVTINN